MWQKIARGEYAPQWFIKREGFIKRARFGAAMKGKDMRS